MSNIDFKMALKELTDHIWSRVKSLFTGLDARVTALEQGGGEENVIESITLNGSAVPPDANKNVALAESDPTVPTWAKQATKPTYTAAEVGAVPSPIVLPNVDLNEPDNGITMLQNAFIEALDKNGSMLGRIQFSAYKDGATYISLYAGNKRDGYTYSFGIRMIHNKDGTGSYIVSYPDSFRNAILAKATQSPVTSPTASGTAVAFIDTISQNAQGVITPTKKTVPEASQSAAGLMSANDKTKLDGIEAGAQVNSVTGVKGDKESDYRQGNVNLTPANIGAVDVSDIIDVQHGGTGANTAAVALQNLYAFGKGSLLSGITDANKADLYGVGLFRASAVEHLPSSETSGVFYQVAFMGSLQIAARFNANYIPSVYMRMYTNSAWCQWTLVGVNLTGKSMAQYIRLTGTDWAGMHETLSTMASGEVSPMYASGAATGVLTGGKVNSAVYGTVMRSSTSGTFFFRGGGTSGQYTYSWRIDGLTSATDTPTIGTVYRYAGTAI